MFMRKGVPVAAVLAVGLFQSVRCFQPHHCAKPAICEAKASRSTPENASDRTKQTAVDVYFQQHGRLPLPPVVHQVLVPRPESNKRGVLVIGDVHGCYDELLELYQKAVQENGCDFEYVILVGDLCNKGPKSVAVIRHVRQTDGWLTVRGNHDDGALKAALGDSKRAGQEKYAWITTQGLSDQDVMWMANLPYTILIPGSMLREEVDTLIVHAGIVPGQELAEQSISTMTNLRQIGGIPWASVWQGPFRVIFGHDARLGLQQHERAIGLDTGACYGKVLTGMILPEMKIIHVQSRRVYCPIDRNSSKE